MRIIPLALLTSAALVSGCSDTPSPTESSVPNTAAAPEASVAAAAATVVIYPGTSIQTKVNQYPAGTTFLIKAGTHRRQSVVPKSGNTFIGEPGAVLDGERATELAFHGPATRVTVKRLVIRNYKGRAYWGAVHTANGSRWTVDSCDISGTGSVAVIAGNHTRVRWNRVHHNGRLGIGGWGDSILIEGNDVSYSNQARAFPVDHGAGGINLIWTRWLTVRGNRSHHNVGNGIWVDIDGYSSYIARNTVEDNTHQGIMFEISYKAVIRDNVVRRNGFGGQPWLYGAGIFISSSSNVEVYGNTVAGNKNGITAVQQARGSGKYGPYITANVYVHDNKITPGYGVSGIGQDIGNNAIFTSRNNRFARNTYYLGSNARPFHWMNGTRTDAQWRGYGQDVDGWFVR